jgi:GNAT superfamily N-acetyltransferase
VPLEPVRVVLPKGAAIWVRPIAPEDKDQIRIGLDRLGTESNYLRFHRVVRVLTEEELAYLTEVDHRDHDAWGAQIEQDGGREPAGIARYVRLGDSTDAEAAVTVLDEFQGLGIGSFLLEVLARAAMRNGIERFVANVLAENRAMLEVFAHLEARIDQDGPYVTAYLDLPLVHEWAPLPAERVVGSFDVV